MKERQAVWDELRRYRTAVQVGWAYGPRHNPDAGRRQLLTVDQVEDRVRRAVRRLEAAARKTAHPGTAG